MHFSEVVQCTAILIHRKLCPSMSLPCVDTQWWFGSIKEFKEIYNPLGTKNTNYQMYMYIRDYLAMQKHIR